MFVDSEYVQILLHKKQTPGMVTWQHYWTRTTSPTGQQYIHLHAMKNITIIKATAAAEPTVNAYFDLHFVKIRSI